KILQYSLKGILAELAGVILTRRATSAKPVEWTMYELDVIAAVVIGGTCLTGGHDLITLTLLCALTIGALSNELLILNLSSFYPQIVKGAVIFFAVMLDRSKD